MSRNSSGSYTLPVGNPVTTGTTITSSWGNATLTDLATEMTDSLSRSGKGAMSAPLQVTNGSATVPGLTFAGDTNTGLYRSGVDTFSATAGGVEAFVFSNDHNTSALPLALPSGDTTRAALGFTNEVNSGLRRAAAGDLRMEIAGADVQKWTASGVQITGTATVQGNIPLTGSNPSSTTALSNTISPLNIAKAWVTFATNGTSTPTLSDACNVTSLVDSNSPVPAGLVRVTFASPMADTNYLVLPMVVGGNGGIFAKVSTRTTTYVDIGFLDSAGTAKSQANYSGNFVNVLVFGRQ